MTSEQLQNPLPCRKGQLICSQADISVHRKVDLQDEVRMFEEDFKTFVLGIPQFSSNDSEDFGHTDLIGMEIETGNSLYLTETL